MQEVVAVTDFDLYGEAAPGNRTQETTMGDLSADAICWQVTQAVGSAPDAVVLNGGAIRASIKAGEIKLLDIHNVFPFNNQLCTIEVTGAQLLEALEAATQSSPDPMGAFPQVYGIKYTLDTTVPYEKGELYSAPHTTRRPRRAAGSLSTKWPEKNSIRKPHIPLRPMNSLPPAATLIIALPRRAPKQWSMSDTLIMRASSTI
jgi:hypothetical protein